MIALALTLALAAPAAAARAQPDLPFVQVQAKVAGFYSRAYTACQDKAVSTLDITQCASAEQGRWDKRLNAEYARDLASISASEKADLQKAQRAWLVYRDANCAAYEHPEDWGSISRIEATECLLRMTAERTMELQDFPPSGCGKESC